MKKRISFYIFIGCFASCLLSQAQTTDNIIKHLETRTSGSEGVIRIESESGIAALIGNPSSSVSVTGNTEVIERNGFRLQVYMGNDPRNARSEIASRQSSIKRKFSDISTYITYETPNMKLLVGDFVTREEAAVMKKRLEKDFSQFGREIFIVPSKIRIPIGTEE